MTERDPDTERVNEVSGGMTEIWKPRDITNYASPFQWQRKPKYRVVNGNRQRKKRKEQGFKPLRIQTQRAGEEESR